MLQGEWRENVGTYDPELIVTVIPQEYGERYAVAVELRRDDDGPYVIGVTVRRTLLAGYTGGRTHVSPRDVQRLPLAAIIRAALAFASTVAKPTDERESSRVPGGLLRGPVDVLVDG
jgi:hypothetical protein